jgi:mRNA interferase MazF
VTCKPFDIVVVPFPFTDRATVKRRPALVLSEVAGFNASIGHSVLAMITSAQHSAWPFDTPIDDLAAAGLSAASVVRMKLFTLDNQLIIRKAGALAARDRKAVAEALRKLLRTVLRRSR